MLAPLHQLRGHSLDVQQHTQETETLIGAPGRSMCYAIKRLTL